MQIGKATRVLRSGGLVAFPTETVYGLGADASNPEAVAAIFKAKERPENHPLIVHIASFTQVNDWASYLSDDVFTLAQTFWPGPLTMILPRKEHVLDAVTGGQNTIGLRIPSHPVAQALLQDFGGGIAAPSANKFTRLSPTSIEAVQQELGTAVDLILDGGDCPIGLESTIVDMSGDCPTILRPGMITHLQLSDVLNKKIHYATQTTTRAPGMHKLHYAPKTKTILMNATEIQEFISQNHQSNISIVAHRIMSPHPTVINLSNDPEFYAQALYRSLRKLDNQMFDYILIEKVPELPEWEAIRDRLSKACGVKP